MIKKLDLLSGSEDFTPPPISLSLSGLTSKTKPKPFFVCICLNLHIFTSIFIKYFEGKNIFYQNYFLVILDHLKRKLRKGLFLGYTKTGWENWWSNPIQCFCGKIILQKAHLVTVYCHWEHLPGPKPGGPAFFWNYNFKSGIF